MIHTIFSKKYRIPIRGVCGAAAAAACRADRGRGLINCLNSSVFMNAYIHKFTVESQPLAGGFERKKSTGKLDVGTLWILLFP